MASALLTVAALLLCAGSLKSTRIVRSRGSTARLKPVQLQIVHRHGDRTPITPLSDSQYWSSLLPPRSQLDDMAGRTNVIRDENAPPHPAGGGDVFGRLTTGGVERMRKLGRTLRGDVEEAFGVDGVGGGIVPWDDPEMWLRVYSTDFSRTVQSVQAVLDGLLDLPASSLRKGIRNRKRTKVDVDARHTSKMIPDPNPRRYVGQAELERELLSRPRFVEKEEGMKPLAVRLTRTLRESGVLGKEAEGISFGVGEDEAAKKGDNAGEGGDGGDPLPLAWNQLAEILVCLHSQGRLPPSISQKDLNAAAEHNARRWFDLLGDPRLAAMAIKSLAKKMVLNAEEAVAAAAVAAAEEGANANGARGARDSPAVSTDPSPSSPGPAFLHVFSGHDATLIALLCAFQLERPAVWPEYGSFLKMELLRLHDDRGGEEDDDDVDDPSERSGTTGAGENSERIRRKREKLRKPPEFYVRFSLDGVPLRSRLGDINNDARGRAGGSGGGTPEKGAVSDVSFLLRWEDLRRGLDEMERVLPPLAASDV